MQRMLVVVMALCGCLLVSISASAQKPSLKGSKASVNRMDKEAETEDLSYLGTGAKVKAFFRGGLLVELKGNGNYHLGGVSYPYVRREVKLFVERLSEQSRSVCSDGLTITSSTRPINEQPRNASKKSVHPTGMAVDFRVPSEMGCRKWLEKTLLALEARKVLEATRERRPPHYHVAVFLKPYDAYVDSLKETAKEKKKIASAKAKGRK
jgi:hypothetical protein